MPDELLPPDPSRDAYYHVITEGDARVWFWVAKNKAWTDPEWGQFYPQDAINIACLASPHPIPTPEQLDALHALPDAMIRAELMASDQADPRSIAIGRGAAERSATMLRAALGAKPDDASGGSI